MLASKLELAVQYLISVREELASLANKAAFDAACIYQHENSAALLVSRIERELDLLRQELQNFFPTTSLPFVVRYRLVGATTALFCQDFDLRYLWASAGFRVNEHEDWLGKRDEEMLPKADAAHITEIKRAVLARGQGRSASILSPVGGQNRYMELVLEPWRDASSQVIGLIGACTDVTLQRQAQGKKERQQALMRQQQAQLRQLNLHLAMVQAVAERDISRHLHDRVGASLTLLHLDLTKAARELAVAEPNFAVVRKLLEDSLQLAAQVSDGTSRVVEELRPPHLENEGLATALLWYIETSQHRVNFAMTVTADPDFPRLEPVKEYELYLIAQEAVTNAVKHSQAQQVAVSLHATVDRVCLTIADNGVGIDFASNAVITRTAAHWGLVNMAERAELIGGFCSITSRPDAGTQVVVEVPR